MSVRKAIGEKSGIYFITLTCRGWHPLFSITDGFSAVYRWSLVDYLKSMGRYILGYDSFGEQGVYSVMSYAELKDKDLIGVTAESPLGDSAEK
jgi:hypothetical protein